jgi:hypothetical protein
MQIIEGRKALVRREMGRYRPKVDGQGSELAAEELPFEVHRARFVPVNSIL